jgi:nicotinamidase-related amidase
VAVFLKEKESQRSPQLLSAKQSLLLIIDVQEKFASGIPQLPALAQRVAILGKAAKTLDVPILASEQNPKSLGPTLPAITEVLGPNQVYHSKMAFSLFDVEACAEMLKESRRRQIVVCGIEAHVCVLQSVADILENLGAQVCVVKDAVGSRKDSDRDAGLDRMLQLGAQLVTTEMVVFEWLRQAGTPEFKALQALVK